MTASAEMCELPMHDTQFNLTQGYLGRAPHTHVPRTSFLVPLTSYLLPLALSWRLTQYYVYSLWLKQGITHRYPAPKPLPLARPTFKFSDVQKAVPRHCFKRDLKTSAFHLASDLVLVSVFGYLATFISHGAIPAWAGYLLWPLYWFVQGTQMTGVWVIAHECGHQAFSDSQTINNLVGLVCHSMLLVPYHSWRITHGKHHNNTGSCEHDEVFCPPTRTACKKSPTAEEDMAEIAKEAPLVQIFWISFTLVFGWLPGYLCFNATGPSKYAGFSKSHFNPWAKVTMNWKTDVREFI